MDNTSCNKVRECDQHSQYLSQRFENICQSQLFRIAFFFVTGRSGSERPWRVYSGWQQARKARSVRDPATYCMANVIWRPCSILRVDHTTDVALLRGKVVAHVVAHTIAPRRPRQGSQNGYRTTLTDFPFWGVLPPDDFSILATEQRKIWGFRGVW